MIRDRVGIILRRPRARGHVLHEQGAPVERGGEPRDQGATLDVGAGGEGARAAAEDVGGGGLGEVEPGAEGEEGVGYAARDGGPLGLGVDGEGGAGVLGPDAVDVGLVVGLEEGAVQGYAVVGGEGAEVAAAGGGDDEGGPAGVVGGLLGGEGGADLVEAGRAHACYGLGGAGGVGEGQGDGDGDEIDVGDVGEELGAVPGEFAEVPLEIGVGVGGVCDGGFDEAGTRIEEEGQGAVDGEPDAAARDVGNGCGDCVPRRAEGNGTVLSQRLAGGRR